MPNRRKKKSQHASSHDARKTQRNLRLFWLAAIALSIISGIGYRWVTTSIRNGDSKLESKSVLVDSAGNIRANTDTVSNISLDSTRRRIDKHAQVLDPVNDDWTSEAFAEVAQTRTNDFLAALRNVVNGAAKPNSLAAIVATDFRYVYSPANPLDDIEHGSICFRTENEVPETTVDKAELPDLWVRQFSSFRIDACSHKIVEVKQLDRTYRTRHEIEITGISQSRDSAPTSRFEQHEVWTCEWSDGNTSPDLTSIRVEQSERSTSSGANAWFQDQTMQTIGTTTAFQNQLQYGLNHWLSRIPTSYGMYLFAENGIAVGDVNGDQLEDIYVCQPGGLPNRLFLHQPDGRVVDYSQDAGVDWLDQTSSALFVDLDNDGDQDLLTAIENQRVLVMENDGRAHFRLAAELLIQDRHVQGLCAADYDGDGDVDIYLTVGFASEDARPGEPRPEFVYHDANEGGANILFRNEIQTNGSQANGSQVNGSQVNRSQVNDTPKREWKFSDVTKSVGLDVNNRRHSLAASWEDFDNDGDQDLYVANDYGQNVLYRNDDGQFVDIARETQTVDSGSGMSVSWSDFDGDGFVDLYVGNMFSSAGNRITRQPKFEQQVGANRSVLTRFAKGNTLFRNLGDGTFADIGENAGVQMGRWAWSSLFADINNDGFDDILVTNGYITNAETTDL